MQIKFQTALITGSSRGLGRQIAVKLATEGVKKIAIHYRTGKSDAETTLSLIEAQGSSGVLVQGDVADAVVAKKLVKEVAQSVFHQRSDNGEVYACWRTNHWSFVYPRWKDRWLATLGRHGTGEGGNG